MIERFSDQDLARIADAVTRQNDIDRESAGPKVPYERILYKEIILSSRYCVAHEFAAMRRVVDAMPQLIAKRIESIWCDSLACCCYIVMVKTGLYAPKLAESVRDSFQEVGGHNGITIYNGNGKSVEFDPYWPGEDITEFDGPMPTP